MALLLNAAKPYTQVRRKEQAAMIRRVIYIVAALLSVVAIVTVVRIAVRRLTCEGETRLKIGDPSGLRFEVEYKSCDTLAKDEAVSVYAIKAAPQNFRLLSKWGDQRTLLFRYDPGRWDNPLPLITRPSPSSILISVPQVSSIEHQNREWERMSVNYAIGHVDYPAASK